jgi:hypothetical protein
MAQSNVPWSDYIYDDESAGDPTYTVIGLNLPEEVLNYIFYKNSKK